MGVEDQFRSGWSVFAVAHVIRVGSDAIWLLSEFRLGYRSVCVCVCVCLFVCVRVCGNYAKQG